MLRIIRWALCLGVAAGWGADPAVAQLTRGFISGTITDSSGAILPAVQVKITNTATNITRQMVSNDAGFYRFVAVEPGTYAVEFALSGFSPRKVDNIAVGAAQEKVVDQTMSVGGVTAEISVVETPGIELAKTNSTIAQTISERV